MNTLKRWFIISGKYMLVSLGALALFGILLVIAWTLPAVENTGYKLVTSIGAAGCAILVGGFVIGKLARTGKTIQQATGWGFLIGFAGFGYLFGIDWKWPAALLISGALATLGGWISQR